MSKTSKSSESEVVSLPPIMDGEKGSVITATSIAKHTSPPSPYTEGTLLDDMRAAAKYVEDSELKKILKNISGLGTAATRAAIIETLKNHKYLEKSGKNIVSTDKAQRFVEWGKPLCPDLFDVAQTARWQAKLEVLETDPSSSRTAFESQVESFVKTAVTIFKTAPALGGANQLEKDNMSDRTPTEKMQEFAKKIAAKMGKSSPPEGVLTDFEKCKEFIDANKEFANAPSVKQIAFAERIAKDKGVTLPEDARKDSKLISAWIDANKG